MLKMIPPNKLKLIHDERIGLLKFNVHIFVVNYLDFDFYGTQTAWLIPHSNTYYTKTQAFEYGKCGDYYISTPSTHIHAL